MKKILSILMICSIIFCFAACGDKEGTPTETTNPTSGTLSSERETDGQSAENVDAQPSSTQAPTQSAEPEQSAGKALVVYFSATGNTKAAAEALAEMQNADIYEIVPQQPYTDDDLNYNDRSSRSTVEQNDASARPAISGSIENLESYDVIYVGYPIWWGDMPRILYTFFDSYDFSGKTIAPFCTSGGSGLSGTPGIIAGLESGAEVSEGLHIRDSAASNAQSELAGWVASIEE